MNSERNVVEKHLRDTAFLKRGGKQVVQALVDIALGSGIQRVGRGEVLTRQGQLGSSMFIVLEGKVEAFVDGKPAHVFEADSRLGERTLLRQDEEVGATCIVSSQVCRLIQISSTMLVRAILPVTAQSVVGQTTMLGRKNGDVANFFGIRFARAERFQAPRVVSQHEYRTGGTEPLARVILGPACPQASASALVDQLPEEQRAMLPVPKSSPKDLLFLPCDEYSGTLVGADRVPTTEDCLQLNVSRPSSAHRDANLPVLVFIHGGAFVQGSGGIPLYDGSELARRGCVVVTINYRLGALGFLRTKGFPANVGLLDQFAALEWVQENIASFGGDASRVTVFGESAGAMSIGCLLGSAMRIGERGALFHKAILQSGAALNVHNQAQAEETAKRFYHHLGTAEAPRVRVSEIVRASQAVGLEAFRRKDLFGKVMAFQPVVCAAEPQEDPVFRGVPPTVAIEGGIARSVPCLIGCTKHEYALFMLGQGNDVKSLLGKSEYTASGYIELVAQRIAGWLANPGSGLALRKSDASSIDKAREIVVNVAKELNIDVSAGKLSKGKASLLLERVMTLWLFEVPCARLAQLQSRHGDVFMYRMDVEASLMNLRACHALELPLVFGTHKHRALQMLFGGSDAAGPVSEQMTSAWATFASTGAPRASGWPKYDSSKPLALAFGVEGGADSKLVSFPLAQLYEQQMWHGVARL